MCLAAMPTRGKDHRHAKAARPTVRSSNTAADLPTPRGTTARARRHRCLPLAVGLVPLAAATGGDGLADGLSPDTDSLGARPAAPHETLDSQEHAHAPTLSAL
jgi:hypothetical protein